MDNKKWFKNLERINLAQVYQEALFCEYVKTSSVAIKGKHIWPVQWYQFRRDVAIWNCLWAEFQMSVSLFRIKCTFLNKPHQLFLDYHYIYWWNHGMVCRSFPWKPKKRPSQYNSIKRHWKICISCYYNVDVCRW
jgi:hypothetical protein